MPVAKMILTSSTTALDDYLNWAQSIEVAHDGEEVLSVRARAVYAHGQHCRPETAKLEFRDLREEHGQQNSYYRVPARYEAPEGPAEATHIKVGKNWRIARPGEKATAQRVRYLEARDDEIPTHVAQGKRVHRLASQDEEPTHVRHVDMGDGTFPESEQRSPEGQHWIYSHGLHEVNPDDPEACEKAFDGVVALWAQERPGVQAEFVAHGDAHGSEEACSQGEGGKFHVHVMENAVVHSEMTVLDRAGKPRTFKPGTRVAGALTDVELFRARSDEFLKTRGKEFGLGPQVLEPRLERNLGEGRAAYSTKVPAVRATEHDFWTRQRGLADGTGAISHQDQVRGAVETALEHLNQDPARMRALSEPERMDALKQEVERASDGEVTLKLRRTKAGDAKLRSFAVEGRKQALTATQLGENYTDANLQLQLEMTTFGYFHRRAPKTAGPPKPIDRATDGELKQLQRVADSLAAPQQIAAHWDEAQVMNARFDELAQVSAEQKKHRDKLIEQATQNPDAELAAKAVWTTERIGTGMDSFELRRADVFATQDQHGLGYEQALVATQSAMELERRAAQQSQEKQQADKSVPADQRHEHQQEHEQDQQKPQSSQSSQNDAEDPKKPVAKKPHDARRLGMLAESQMKNRELVAIVRKEREDGGAYIDFQLAAEDPAAAGQPGLNLMTAATKDGKPARTWQQVTPDMYERLKTASAGNETSVPLKNGQSMTAYRLRGDLERSLKGTGDYHPNKYSFERSSIPARPDVVAKQRQHEASNRTEEREQQHRQRESEMLNESVESLGKDITEQKPDDQLTAHERAFNREQARRNGPTSRGR